MIKKRDLLKSALNITAGRPSADLTIEQYLMTAESLVEQVLAIEPIFRNKKILHLGDDDHLSVLFAHYLDCRPFVAEYDARIRKSLKNMYQKYHVETYDIIDFDARNLLPSHAIADAFYINPPYSSKNNGKGAKVWISRVSGAVPVGSTSILVYPIDESLPWTLSCFNEILDFAYKQGFMVTNIDRDLHTYEYLPKDPGLLSSNIYLYKFEDREPIPIEDTENESLYR
jgi:predicted methyltransferase